VADNAGFEIRHTQFLDPEGRESAPLPEAARAPGAPLQLAAYRAMVLTRTFDRKAIALQRTGLLGTYASPLGQEAIGVGVALAMLPEDCLLPAYRDLGAQFLRGVRMMDILLYWGGDERGMVFAGPRQDFPICVPVGSHACHAVGVATAFQYRREPRVAVCLLGDGATSKGDFYEALNLAGVWGLPVVFVINNNQWAISVPRARQCAAPTLAQKAFAAGIPGEQVDGNDAIAVWDRVGQALALARGGGGPTLIECLTYRLGDHTTADDASRYRDPHAAEAHWPFEPLRRLKAWLMAAGLWDEAQETALQAECAAAVEEAARAYLAEPPQAPESMFDSLYATLPAAYAEQRAEVAGRPIEREADDE
jgi:pyruvate dehydrogenase E1 component alpha subunit